MEGDALDGRRPRLLAVTAVAIVAAVASLAVPASGRQAYGRGGTYRVGWELAQGRLGFLGGLDPTVEFSFGSSGIYSSLLVRTLVGYRHVAGRAGQELVPDLARRVPRPTGAGTTYAFTLKRGIRFGPPVNREITAGDIRYAIARIARPENDSIWVPAFDDIRGFAAFRRGKAASISGIETPSAKTIVFHLIRPAGDFLNRLALPAAGPVPREVARCFEGRPGYGADLVSSGPYALEGASAVDIRSCGSILPMRGYTESRLTLVRNPRYDQRTDSRTARENNPDRFVFVADLRTAVLTSYAPTMVRRLGAGELDDAFLPSFWPLIVKHHAPRAARQGQLRRNPWGELLYVSMNLTQPPFDDVHVRRAMSWIVDRAALRATYGGRLAGRVAGHLLPDELLDGELRGFAPFETPGDHGSLARARAEMRKSRYETRNGVCIATVCRGVRMGAMGPYAPSQRVKEIVKANAAMIGIRLINRRRPPDEPASNNELLVNEQWVAPWPDPSSFMEPLLAGWSIDATRNVNHSLVGITPQQARRLGVKGRVRGIPSVDAGVARCNALSGEDRLPCFAALDRRLTTEIVPWIPFLWRDSVTILGPQTAKWTYDQAAGTTGFAHVALRH
jgi:peptide/nickel transport system substrate-binding protein